MILTDIVDHLSFFAKFILNNYLVLVMNFFYVRYS